MNLNVFPFGTMKQIIPLFFIARRRLSSYKERIAEIHEDYNAFSDQP